MSDDVQDLRTDNPEQNIANLLAPGMNLLPGMDSLPGMEQEALIPELAVDVPEADLDTQLTPDEIVEPTRVFPQGAGLTPIVIEKTVNDVEGFYFFIQGYPLFLPRDVAEQLANFILIRE